MPIQPLPVSTETEKPKRLRKTPADPKAKVVKPSKPSLDAQATLARLETDLTAKQTLLSAVQQERDDWSRRVATLREKGKDPAGLGLAQKSLARAEVDVSVAKKAVDHLLPTSRCPSGCKWLWPCATQVAQGRSQSSRGSQGPC